MQDSHPIERACIQIAERHEMFQMIGAVTATGQSGRPLAWSET
jgi:hypothetical protein